MNLVSPGYFKKITAALFGAALFCMQPVRAQAQSRLKLSTNYPEAGNTIKLSYDSVGAPLGGKKNIAAIAYFLDHDKYPGVEVPLKLSGNVFNGELTIPTDSKALLIKVVGEDKTDNNNGAGYLYQIFKGKKPVPGAYAMEAYVYTGAGSSINAAKTDIPKLLGLYKQEFTLNPDMEKDYADIYYYYLSQSNDDKALITQKINKLKASSDEKELLNATYLLVLQKRRPAADSLYAIVKEKFPDSIGAKNTLTDGVLKDKPLVFPFGLPSELQGRNRVFYGSFADTYATILYQQRKPNEALKYEEIAWVNFFHNSGNYVRILDALDKTDEVIKIASESVKSGRAGDEVKEALKKNYTAKNGADAYDKYIADLNRVPREELRAKIAATIINEPAADFQLKDLNGNTVSLKSLRGKTLVLDFWATWCGPCKASFPGMQLAVNKYKNDPNIQFLFVDTREVAKNYKEIVKKYIYENKYPFPVLFDEKTKSGEQNKTLAAYGVTSIPAKFVIDKTDRYASNMLAILVVQIKLPKK